MVAAPTTHFASPAETPPVELVFFAAILFDRWQAKGLCAIITPPYGPMIGLRRVAFIILLEENVELLDQLKYDSDGLIPAIVQDAENGDVLMVGYMNRQSVERTIREKMVCFWSRSRQKYWVKGETSGHFQLVKDIYVDCDQDALLVKVTQIGATCHEGYRSCFFRKISPKNELDVIAERIVNPEEVYGK